ncbi:MAG TPA: ABC transporter ATP-binding protein [Steroidobacteraceae bacterium]|nr:ABC transporter ATP-binding protein [Steroidobacteraceae bacterium]
MLVVRKLSRRFREGGRVLCVLEAVDLEIATGCSVAITGRSGSGKSTLLNLLCGIDHPDSGTIELDGLEIGSLREPARTQFRRSSVGFVHQFFNLIPTLDVEENVRLALELNAVRGAEARRRSAALLASVGLGDRLRSAVDALSGGEQQRVAIARALVHRPKLLLADEPTGNLDEATAGEVMPLIRALAREHGATLVLVTHDQALAAAADRVLELRDGRVQ